MSAVPRLFLCLLAVACSCKPQAAPPDAGTVFERGTDLRSALTTIFPEYRGVAPLLGRAQVTRWVAPAAQKELDAALAAAAKNGFSGEPLKRDVFVIEFELDGGVLQEQVTMPLTPSEIGRIQAAPAAMSSEGLANWLPKVGNKQREELLFELVWMAKDVARADFIVWQLVNGALGAGWTLKDKPSGFELERVDGGLRVPQELLMTLLQDRGGAAIEIERKADRAWIRYRLVTYERR